jgi:hypothetical protein
MKFELIGQIEQWITVHTDGFSKNCTVREQFSAANKDEAVRHVKELTKKWPTMYSKADTEFQGAKVELRIINPIWHGELKPEKTTVTKKVPVTIFKLKGSPRQESS